MDNRVKRDANLINLISDFEAKNEIGQVGYIDEKDFLKLLEYYEDEYLFDKALDVVNIALDQYTFRSEFYIIKGRILINLQKAALALEILEDAEHIAPFEREIKILKAKALALLKRIDEALEIIDIISVGATISDKGEILVTESFIFESMKDYHKMYEKLEEALKLDYKNDEALERIWISVELSRKYEESVSLHLWIIENDPYNYQAWYNLGHAYSCLSEYEKAIEALEYSFLSNSEFENGYLDCADICLQVKNYQKALDIFLEIKDKFGASSEVLQSIAQCYIFQNKTKVAKQWLFKAIKYDAFNDEAYFHLAECYAKENVWYNAINAYHKAIKLDNRREEYFLGLAKAYWAVEDFKKAKTNFQLAIQTGPEDSLYWFAYVSFLISLGQLDEANEILEEAEDNTYGTDLQYAKAAICFLSGEREECLEYLEEALIENFAIHYLIYELAPEMKLDKKVNAIIKYFAD